LGEIQELKFSRKKPMSPESYLDMIGNKTASLFSAACHGGATAADGSRGQASALGAFGHALGMAFQIRDDVLDVCGEKKQTGKPVGLDLQEGRMTLPFLLGLQTRNKNQRRALLQELAEPEPRLGRLMEILESSGAMAQCQQRALHYADKARAHLKGLRASKAKQQLMDLAQFAVERNF
jgi:heptaprenyl diphosphate synthase